ncbi:hypothetical protein IHQ56_04735 [Methylobacillus flagellatus]|uniref:hypothetical protein n=1 Tax=Methylobacillus TaxID=404 RepID=UPI002853DB65|nr:hypothetical protein [Methylobacillus flagellatus]MDR5171119.1 hypothetical protein [Methylobacillus flagellatus]
MSADMYFSGELLKFGRRKSIMGAKMIESFKYKDFDVQIKGSNFFDAGFTYSVLIDRIEHHPWVKPLSSWEEAKLQARQYAIKLIDQIF